MFLHCSRRPTQCNDITLSFTYLQFPIYFDFSREANYTFSSPCWYLLNNLIFFVQKINMRTSPMYSSRVIGDSIRNGMLLLPHPANYDILLCKYCLWKSSKLCTLGEGEGIGSSKTSTEVRIPPLDITSCSSFFLLNRGRTFLLGRNNVHFPGPCSGDKSYFEFLVRKRRNDAEFSEQNQ